MANENIIELNGKRYDAITGHYLGAAETPDQKLHAKPADGVSDLTPHDADPSPAARRSAKPVHHVAVVHHVETSPNQSTVITVRRGAPQHAPIHQPQHSQTLMRSAVAPPAASLKRKANPQTSTNFISKQPQIDVAPKQFVTDVDAERLRRSGQVERNQLIRHFDLAASQHAPVAHVKPPLHAVQAPPVPKLVKTPAVRQRSQEVFDRALANATSHKQPTYRVKRSAKKPTKVRSFVSVSASVVTIVLIIGFIAYQNASAIQIRLASSRAGVNASLPKWRPDGFAIGTFSYKPGTVSIKYNDPQASRSFTVTQAATSWDSSALLSDFVLPNNETFDTIQADNNTIYTYGNNNATWINSGIWYELTTDGSLSNSQLIKLASSM